MSLDFCTLFDSNYLIRGITLYRSLQAQCPQSRLFVYTFDTKATLTLRALNLPGLFVVSLEDFETEELLSVKRLRSPGEYCWTCTPAIIADSISRFNLKQITYLDADIFFFKSPSPLEAEFEGSKASALITEHRYTPVYDQAKTSGRFCVQYLSIRNNPEGLEILESWRSQCLEWCYARYENGKFGDQKYLDSWPEKFSNVHILQHIGGGVAPWNVQQYKIGKGPSVNDIPVVFFHFHGFKCYSSNRFRLASSYRLPKESVDLIYSPYIDALLETRNLLASRGIDDSFDFKAESFTWRDYRSSLKHRLLGKYYVVQR